MEADGAPWPSGCKRWMFDHESDFALEDEGALRFKRKPLGGHGVPRGHVLVTPISYGMPHKHGNRMPLHIA